MNIKTKIALLFFIAIVCSKCQAQKIFVAAGLQNKWTVEKSIYTTVVGIGPTAFFRYKPFKFAHLQLAYSRVWFLSNDYRIKKYEIKTLDWKLGIIPSQKFPIQITIGGLLNYYKYTTNKVLYQDLVFIPELTDKRTMDAIQIGVAYPIKKWLEISINFEKEPFLLWYHPRNASYLTLGIVAIVGPKKAE